jgi:hypothetical protein
MPRALNTRVVALARRRGITVSGAITMALWDYVEIEGETGGKNTLDKNRRGARR